jgi:hypothetical protein
MKKILLSTVLVASSWVLFAQDTTNRTNTTTNQQTNTSTNQNNTNMNSNNTSDQMYNNSSTSNYSAYGIPNYVQMNFQTQYPNVSNLTWTAPTAGWYHGYYSNNGRYTHVYYSTDPYYNVQYYPERVTGYTVSLPVLQTWVPDEVITTATNLYKQNLYDITALRRGKSNNNMNNNNMNNSSNMSNSSNMNNSSNMSSSSNGTSGNNGSQDVIYQVRVLDNGEMKSMWMDANGTAVTDYWRTADQNMNTTTDMNSNMSTDTNAAMDNGNMNNNATKVKTKTKMSDGSQIKTKTKNGKTRTKKTGSSSNTTDQL